MRFTQPLKALLPIRLMLPAIVTVLRVVRPSNASGAIWVILRGPRVAGIVRLPPAPELPTMITEPALVIQYNCPDVPAFSAVSPAKGELQPVAFGR